MKKCLFDQWYDGEAVSLNNFTKKLFDAFMVADGDNREVIKNGWPEWFENLQSF